MHGRAYRLLNILANCKQCLIEFLSYCLFSFFIELMVDGKSCKKSTRCTYTNLLCLVAVVGLVLSGILFYTMFVCDLTNEYREMDCPTIFVLSLLPKVFTKRISLISLLADWGIVDYRKSIRSCLDSLDVNTTHLFDFCEVPVTTQELQILDQSVYTYTPNELMSVPNQPAVIHFHGGGGIMLTPKYFDATMKYLSYKLMLKLIVPDYPKSPEVLFPTAHEACLNVVKYIFENSNTFSVDPKRISLSGDSFGGHVALYVAFKWNELSYDEKYAPLLAMNLIYPWVQFVNLKLDSYLKSVNQRIITPESTAIGISFVMKGDLELVELVLNSSLPLLSLNYQERQKQYPELLPKLNWTPPASMVDKYSVYADKVLDPYASFLFQSDSDFSHLPPTLLISAGYDILLSEGLLLKQRMQESGVSVEHHTFDKIFHGFFGITRIKFLNLVYSPVFEAIDRMEEFFKKYTA